jgi:hypothetical protein
MLCTQRRKLAASKTVAYERGSLNAEPIHEVNEVTDQRPVRIISIRGITGLPIAATGYSDNAVTSPQERRELIERMGGTSQAGQQNHGRALSPVIDVVKADGLQLTVTIGANRCRLAGGVLGECGSSEEQRRDRSEHSAPHFRR